MKLIDAMIAWTPNRDPCKGFSTTGSVIASEGPLQSEHFTSFGVCNAGWRDITHRERLDRVQDAIRIMVHEDAMSPSVIQEALANIEDIQPEELNFEPTL